VAEIDRDFDDLNLGFVDAAVVAIAEELGLPRIATTDHRDFLPLAGRLSLEIPP
jgi:hypothetical protein